MTKEELQYLAYPMYELYYVYDVHDLHPRHRYAIHEMPESVGPEVFERVLRALKWIARHPEVDLSTILPGIPHTNEDIHAWLSIVRDDLQGKQR